MALKVLRFVAGFAGVTALTSGALAQSGVSAGCSTDDECPTGQWCPATARPPIPASPIQVRSRSPSRLELPSSPREPPPRTAARRSPRASASPIRTVVLAPRALRARARVAAMPRARWRGSCLRHVCRGVALWLLPVGSHRVRDRFGMPNGLTCIAESTPVTDLPTCSSGDPDCAVSTEAAGAPARNGGGQVLQLSARSMRDRFGLRRPTSSV